MPLLLRYLAISGHKDLVSNTSACLLFFQTCFQSLRVISILWGLLSPRGPAQLQQWKQRGQGRGWGGGTGVVMMRPLKPCKPQGIPVTNPVERPRVREKGDKIVAVLNRPSCEAALEPVFTQTPSLCKYHLGRPFPSQTPRIVRSPGNPLIQALRPHWIMHNISPWVCKTIHFTTVHFPMYS